MALLPIKVLYQTGQAIYAFRLKGVDQVWNTITLAYETFNPSNWANYAIALAELGASGIYTAAYPVSMDEDPTYEVFFPRAGGSPAPGDAPGFTIAESQGQSVSAIKGSGPAAANLGDAVESEQRGAVVGTILASSLVSDATGLAPDLFINRQLVFISGTSFKSVGRIIGYATDGTITVAAPWAVVPVAGDKFLVI